MNSKNHQNNFDFIKIMEAVKPYINMRSVFGLFEKNEYIDIFKIIFHTYENLLYENEIHFQEMDSSELIKLYYDNEDHIKRVIDYYYHFILDGSNEHGVIKINANMKLHYW